MLGSIKNRAIGSSYKSTTKSLYGSIQRVQNFLCILISIALETGHDLVHSILRTLGVGKVALSLHNSLTETSREAYLRIKARSLKALNNSPLPLCEIFVS